MDKKLLRDIVRKRTGNVALIPEVMRICNLKKNAASSRLSGLVPFRSDEIEAIRTEYGMTDEEVVSVFIKKEG